MTRFWRKKRLKVRASAVFIDVEHEYDHIVTMARNMVEDEKNAKKNSGGSHDVKSALLAKQDQGERMTPRTLDRVVEALKVADLTNMVRRQYVCTVDGPQMVPTPKFSELFYFHC